MMQEEFVLYDKKAIMASVPTMVCSAGHVTYQFTMTVSHPGNVPDNVYTFCPDCAGLAAQAAFPVVPA